MTIKKFNELHGRYSIGLNLSDPESKIVKIDSNDCIALPCHDKSYYDIVKNTLKKKIVKADDIFNMVKEYNGQKLRNFKCLRAVAKKNSKFISTVNKIRDLVFKIESMPAIPVLKDDMTFSLSQEQIGVLLANAFFCTFPERVQPFNFPTINFNNLFDQNISEAYTTPVEKLKCILNYFDRITQHAFSKDPGLVTFSRKQYDQQIYWRKCYKPLKKVFVDSDIVIESMTQYLTVDFANKLIGGGVLGRGCVQEEIRCLIEPEMIVARLFTPALRDNEVVLVTGCERFSDYTGYAKTFKFLKDHVDHQIKDSFNRRRNQVVVMDAFDFKDNPQAQYDEKMIQRELYKAYCAFYDYDAQSLSPPAAVVTGNWGCGAFKGDPQFKFLIQWCSASMAGRDVYYSTYKDEKLRNAFISAYGTLKYLCFTIADVYDLLCSYQVFLLENPNVSILQYINDNYGSRTNVPKVKLNSTI